MNSPKLYAVIRTFAFGQINHDATLGTDRPVARRGSGRGQLGERRRPNLRGLQPRGSTERITVWPSTARDSGRG